MVSERCSVTNNITAYNRRVGINASQNYSTVFKRLEYNLAYGNKNLEYGSDYPEYGNNYQIYGTFSATNILSDPKFINSDSDFHLSVGSPAIKAGDPEIKDKNGFRLDLGVYAEQPDIPVPTMTPTTALTPTITPTIGMSYTTRPTPTISPTIKPPVRPGSVACGQINNDPYDEILDIDDLIRFASVYHKYCNDTNNYMLDELCGRKDTDKNGYIDIDDLIRFAVRYRKPACGFYQY
jgi:hypothetical protein